MPVLLLLYPLLGRLFTESVTTYASMLLLECMMDIN